MGVWGRPRSGFASLLEQCLVTKVTASGNPFFQVDFSQPATAILRLEPSFEVNAQGLGWIPCTALTQINPSSVAYGCAIAFFPGDAWRWTARPVSLKFQPAEFPYPQSGVGTV